MLTLGKDNAPSRLAPKDPGHALCSIAIVAPIAVIIDRVDFVSPNPPESGCRRGHLRCVHKRRV